MDLSWLKVSFCGDIWLPSSWSSVLYRQISENSFSFLKPPSGQFSAKRVASAFALLIFFLRLLPNEGKLPLTGTLPPVEMAFLVRCYANCLQPWSSKVSDVVIPFSGQCLWLWMLPPLRVCVCICVCFWEKAIGWGSEKMSFIHLHIHDMCFRDTCMFCFGFNVNFKPTENTNNCCCWYHAKVFSSRCPVEGGGCENENERLIILFS